MSPTDPNRLLRVAASLSLAATLAVGVACGRSKAAGDASPSGYCAEVRLAEASAHPLDEIEILGLDPARSGRPIDALHGLFSPVGADRDEAVPTLIRLDRTPARLVVPPHPDGIAGGEGRLRITDANGLPCPEVDLRIEPLPAAPGTAREVADRLETLVLGRAALYGYDREQLRKTPGEELPLAVVGQAMALWALEGPDNPRSLRAQVAAGVPDTVDALYARAQVPRLLDTLIARQASAARSTHGGGRADPSLPRLSDLLPQQPERRRLDPLAALGTLAFVPGTGALRGAATIERLQVEPEPIETAAELSDAMERQAEAARTLSGATGKYLDDLGTATALVGIYFPAAGAAGGAAHLVLVKSIEYDRQLLPCCFEDFGYEPERTSFEEDFPYPSERATWNEVRVVARNRGWNLTETAIQGAFTTLGAGKGAKAAFEKAAARRAGSQWDPGLLNSLEETGVDGWLQKNVKPEIRELTVPPHTWPPIDLSADAWNQGEAEGAIALHGTRHYYPAAVGEGKLSVGTTRGAFGTEHEARSVLVEVKPIVVTVTPQLQRVEPGETVELRAFVRNAVNPEMLVWRFTARDGSTFRPVATEYLGSGVHRAVLAAPPDEGAFPVEAEAESTSNTGLRTERATRRSATATLTVGVVVDIGPEPACVEPGEELQMFAEVVGAHDTSLRWSADGPATIDPRTGLLAATGDGEVTVTGISHADPEAEDEAHVQVGDCSCRFSAILSGDTMRGNARGRIALFSTEGEATALGGLVTPGAWGDEIRSLLGDEQAERTEEMQRRGRDEMGGQETLGLGLVEMDPEGSDESILAAIFGGFRLQASVIGEAIEPGFSGALPLSSVHLGTGEWDGSGSGQIRYVWLPGEPGNVRLLVSQYTGRSLSGTLTGNLFADNVYRPSGSGGSEKLQISISVSFYALETDPMRPGLGCIRIQDDPR